MQEINGAGGAHDDAMIAEVRVDAHRSMDLAEQGCDV